MIKPWNYVGALFEYTVARSCGAAAKQKCPLQYRTSHTHTIQRIYHSVGGETAHVRAVGLHLETSHELEERNFLTLRHQVAESQQLFLLYWAPCVEVPYESKTNVPGPVASSSGEICFGLRCPSHTAFPLVDIFNSFYSFLISFSHFLISFAFCYYSYTSFFYLVFFPGALRRSEGIILTVVVFVYRSACNNWKSGKMSFAKYYIGEFH
jgi:hypothetical protein